MSEGKLGGNICQHTRTHGRKHTVNNHVGGLMSIGMLRAVNLKQMEDCIAHHGQSTGTHV